MTKNKDIITRSVGARASSTTTISRGVSKQPITSVAEVKASKSVQKRVAAQAAVPASKAVRRAAHVQTQGLTEADVQRIVRDFQSADLKTSDNSVAIQADNRKIGARQTTIQGAIDNLSDALSDLRASFSDLQQKLDPVLGPVSDDKLCGSIQDTDATSAVQERLAVLTREVNGLRNWINGIRERVEL